MYILCMRVKTYYTHVYIRIIYIYYILLCIKGLVRMRTRKIARFDVCVCVYIYVYEKTLENAYA